MASDDFLRDIKTERKPPENHVFKLVPEHELSRLLDVRVGMLRRILKRCQEARDASAVYEECRELLPELSVKGVRLWAEKLCSDPQCKEARPYALAAALAAAADRCNEDAFEIPLPTSDLIDGFLEFWRFKICRRSGHILRGLPPVWII
jgi:hypothetical protein